MGGRWLPPVDAPADTGTPAGPEAPRWAPPAQRPDGAAPAPAPPAAGPITGGPGGTGPGAGPDPRTQLAPWWQRALAMIIDTLVLTPFFVVALVAFGGADDESTFEDAFALGSGSTEALVFGLVSAAAFAIYTTVSLALWRGKTVGKHAVGIRVIREDGTAPDWRTAAVRQVPLQAIVASFLPFFGLVDYLWPLFDRENRALHDMLARTRVVRRDDR